MNNEINVKDICKLHYEKESIRIQIFSKILERCYYKIKCNVEQEQQYSIFQVPEFKLGIPLYDMRKCLYYIGAKLMKNGFKVQYYKPNILFIHWELEKPKNNTKLLLEYNKPNNYRSINNNIFNNDILFNNFIPNK